MLSKCYEEERERERDIIPVISVMPYFRAMNDSLVISSHYQLNYTSKLPL